MNGDKFEKAVRRLAAIVESSEDAIISVTLAGEIVTWNGAAERLYGYLASEVVGQPILVLLHPDRHEEMASYLRTIAGGQRVPLHESVRVTKSGSMVDVGIAMSPIRERGGEIVGVSLFERNITEQQWTASRVDEAQKAAERCRRFLSDAAHQLRSPITGAQASVEAILRGAEPPERDRLFGSLVRETARAGHLIASLLRIAHLDEGQPVLPEPCDLVALATEEVDRAWALAPQLDIVLRANAAPDRHPELDARAVREILANLLDNARRYAADRIEVTIAGHGGAVELRVADDGPGLPEGAEDRAFERFASVDPNGGSGLGLAIARGLARANGGDLSWEESTFVLRLPVGDHSARPS